MKIGLNQKTLPFFVLLGGIFAVSTASIFIRMAQVEASSLTIAAYRLVLASLILTPFAWSAHRVELLRLHKKEILWGAGAGLILALHFAFWITSLELTSVASSVVLVTTTPLWVALFSPVFLKESVGRSVWVGLVVALTGGVLIGLNNQCAILAGKIQCSRFDELVSSTNLLGNILALLGAFCSAAYLMIGRRLRERVSTFTYIYVVYSLSAAFLLVFALAWRKPLFGFSPLIYLWFLGLAAIPQLLGHTSFNWSLKYLPAAYVAVALLGEPIGSTILAVVLLKENPQPFELVGGALILLGIILASLGTTNPVRTQPEA